MLTGLQLQNIVLIDQLELEFASGFTVLTGETGAGKSILLDALDAVLGGAQGQREPGSCAVVVIGPASRPVSSSPTDCSPGWRLPVLSWRMKS